jgi:protein TonB
MVPLIWVQGPPRLQWLQPLTAPLSHTPPALTPVTHEQYSAGSVSNLLNNQLITPQHIPTSTPRIDDSEMGPPAPNVPGIDFERGKPDGMPFLGQNLPVVIPKPPAPTHPIRISHWTEGNLIYRVQPIYPMLARQARIQGAVQLRAVISRTGTIERLTVESGHPMLVGAALDAVRQWRYRPYVLNEEPIEIETEITVNFVLNLGG